MEDRGENRITPESAQSTFSGNRYVAWPEDMQNWYYWHPCASETEINSSLRRAAAVQLDWSAGRGKGGSRVTASQAGRTALPFSYSQPSSGGLHTATAGTTGTAHWCKCLESHWGLCEGFVYGTKITVCQGWGMER